MYTTAPLIKIYDYVNTIVYFFEHQIFSWNFPNERMIKHRFGISGFRVMAWGLGMRAWGNG